jgi:hypothetical protein
MGWPNPKVFEIPYIYPPYFLVYKAISLAFFIYRYIFLIGFRFGEKGGQANPLILYYSLRNLAFPAYTLDLSSIKIYSRPKLVKQQENHRL